MKTPKQHEHLRKIPSVDEILRKPEIQKLSERAPRPAIVRAVQMVLAEKRRDLLSAADDAHAGEKDSSPGVTLSQVEAKLQEIIRPSLRRVINATGIVVHTNLGRAPLADEAIACVVEAARRYSNLEFDINRGERGSRYTHVRELLQELSGAQSAFVVNNNAAAVLLCLSTLARGRDVIISRGELIEIGGSFRMPEVMEQSGARLREVGATNRTHLRDYRDAITEQTALILKVHTSNYKIVGFTAEVELRELKKLGDEFHIPVMYDMGSGNLVQSEIPGLQEEPTVQDALRQGIDIVTFSGDKLVGGPQAGIILGSSEYLAAIAKNSLTRALRIDKLTLAALEATLRIYYLDPDYCTTIPVLRMLSVSAAVLKKRAQALVRKLKKHALPLTVSAMQDVSKIGGGAYPAQELPTWVVSLEPQGMSSRELEQKLRTGTPSVIARISRERVLLDMRTLFPEEADMVANALIALFNTAGSRLHNGCTTAGAST